MEHSGIFATSARKVYPPYCTADMRRYFGRGGVPLGGHDMTKRHIITFAVLAAILGAGTAQAADLQKAPVYTKAPPPVEVFNWTGFYNRGNLGFSPRRGSVTRPTRASDRTGTIRGGPPWAN